jgi:Fe-Mn family superoxide dismutase
MEKNRFYTLPQLPYGYKDLEPYMSEEQLKIHHQKHHQVYVNVANAIFEKLEKERKAGGELDLKAILKELSFNIGGHLLHCLFWKNLAPAKEGENKPVGKLAEAINQEFGDFEIFKKEFNKVSLSVEGSGWAALTFCPETQRLLIMQIEKHNLNLYPTLPILLVVDLF